jgi:hypothetical protein
MKAAAVTAVAATATGAGAAWLRSRETIPAVDSVLPPAAQTIITANNQASELLAQLAAAQADNLRLQTELASAHRRLDAQELAAGDRDSTVHVMSQELDVANRQVGLLAGLIALYEQLDDFDLTDLLEEGMNAVSTAIGEVTDELPSLSDGVAMGRIALAELDEQIPILESGHRWLTNQADKLHQYFRAIELVLETAVDRAGPFLEMFSQWVMDILDWLPFGLGQKTSEIMEAMTNLLLETPHTISGLQTNVAEPLAAWLAGSDDEVPLRKKIINPLRDEVILKAEQVSNKSLNVNQVFQDKITRPANTAVASRLQIRHLIATYRQQFQL